MDIHNSATRLVPPGAGPAGPRRPGRWFAVVGAVGCVVLVGLVGTMTGIVWSTALVWALVFYASAFAFAGWAFVASYPHATLGLCNVVTIARLALTATLFGALFVPAPAIAAMLAIASVAFLLDGADGWLARRAGLSSRFGARFDMEVDSAFALILAGLAVKSGLSPWVILLGLPRYAFGVAQWVWPFLNGPLPERFSRKVVCVVQIAVLIVLVLPWIAVELRHGVAVAAGLLVATSFAVDIRALRLGRR